MDGLYLFMICIYLFFYSAMLSSMWALELEAWSHNQWATREDPPQYYCNSFYMVSLFSSLLLQSVLHRAERGALSNLPRPGHWFAKISLGVLISPKAYPVWTLCVSNGISYFSPFHFY